MDEKVKYYTNNVIINLSTYDLQIDFFNNGKNFVLKDGKYTESEVSEYIATINMSVQHAKAFMQILEKNIVEYEKAFGEIKLKPIQQKSQDN